MNKNIVRLIITMIILTNIFVLVSCGKHEHKFENFTIIESANCIKEGLKEWKCVGCEETRIEVIKKFEHAYEIETSQATCKETGLETKICLFCGYKEEKVLEKAEHKLISIEAEDATCKKSGLTEGKKCSVCKEVIVEQKIINKIEHNFENGQCTMCKIEKEHKHDESDWIIITNASCTKEGKKEKKCTICDEIIQEEVIHKIDHDYFLEVISATCLQNGSIKKTCMMCKDIQTSVLEKISHNIVKYDKKEATCTEAGNQAYEKCSLCDYTTYLEIPATGHNFVDKICSICKENAPSEGLIYELNYEGDGYVITGIGTCTDIDIIIPKTYKGLPVKEIADCAFYENEKIVKVSISNNVESIGEEAFVNCKNLKEVIFEKNSKLHNINMLAFANCTSLTSIKFPISTCVIEERAFVDCVNLEEVIFEGNNEAIMIYEHVFLNCKSLKKINIPNNLELLMKGIFKNCVSLKEVIIEEDSKLLYVADVAFENCTSLEKVSFPSSFKGLYDEVFKNCTSLKEVIFDEKCIVEYFGEKTFANCVNLNKVIVPEGITKLKVEEFSGCINLETIILPNTIEEINSFHEFKNLKNVYFKGDFEGWCRVEKYNFSSEPFWSIDHFYLRNKNEYYELTEVVLPATIYFIQNYSFSGMKNLTKATITNEINSLGSGLFWGCTNLSKVVFENNSNLISIGTRVFADCINLKNIEIPNSVEEIEPRVFANCVNLERVVLPEKISEIPAYIFSNCINLKNIVIPRKVKKIEYFAFEMCTSLTSVTIPETVVEMDNSVFNNCSNLTIYCETKEIPKEWHENWNRSNCPVVLGYSGN